MREILMTIIRVAVIIIAYFAIRFAISLLLTEGPIVGWDTTAILGVVLAMLIFVLQYSVQPEKSLFMSLSFLIFFVAGSLFWKTDKVTLYSLQAAIFIFFVFSVILFINSLKSIRKKVDESAKSVGSLAAMCAVYLLIIPAVALAEMFFKVLVLTEAF